ncbi:hypothetical protein [Streptomyces sp. NPDC050600]|uniref:hypothetical protein n=1 Tax=unclassified Streptomyces TaxID=2593676 RepID=UPI00342F5801
MHGDAAPAQEDPLEQLLHGVISARAEDQGDGPEEHAGAVGAVGDADPDPAWPT